MRCLWFLILSVSVHAQTATIRTPAAEFTVSGSGVSRGALLRNGRRLTLEVPPPPETIIVDGVARTFTPETAPATTPAQNSYGAAGWRIEARQRAGAIERTILCEAYRDFPSLLVSSATYRNTGASPARLEGIAAERHAFQNSGGGNPGGRLWSFHGASEEWGADDVTPLAPGLIRANRMGASLANGDGGGVPLIAVWDAEVGEAVGHLETLPLSLAIPVKVDAGGIARTAVEFEPVTLAPGESWSAPRTFLMLFAGDYYEPLRLYSQVMQRQGWKLPAPSQEAYNVSWCGWGYGFNVTAADMLGVIPKLKELGIRWATLDDRWFDTYGDWNPRADTFPGRSMQDMVRQYHREGILVQLWWVPIAAEYPGVKGGSHAYVEARVLREHPDWMVLGPDGRPARMTRGLATLCPALKEVQEYYRGLTEKFIRDWDFDGHKLDNIFSVPKCYNPKHHHRSPDDSVNAMGEVYKIVYETTRRLKPQSVTQSCPCGTPPNIAWLPFMDQSVTADPLSSIQVRRRVKLYKALLGDSAPVYGDHVELTDLLKSGKIADSGRDFASTVGTGGVPGTKFVWPRAGEGANAVLLDQSKESEWKRWLDIYRSKMLSRGEFRNLYVTGFDSPEGYVVEKSGKMYYAFFAGLPDDRWNGRIELRGLSAGRWSLYDYVNGRSLGEVDAGKPFLDARFTGSLLLEASPISLGLNVPPPPR
jgi:alpha-galactosidase